MAGPTRVRTAALAVLFALGLLLHGAAAELWVQGADASSAMRNGWAVAADIAPLPPAALTPSHGSLMPGTPKLHPNGATLAAGPATPGALPIVALPLPGDHRAPRAVPHSSHPSRAPPSAL